MNGTGQLPPPSEHVPITSASQLDSFSYKPEKFVSYPPPTQPHIMRPWQSEPSTYAPKPEPNLGSGQPARDFGHPVQPHYPQQNWLPPQYNPQGQPPTSAYVPDPYPGYDRGSQHYAPLSNYNPHGVVKSENGHSPRNTYPSPLAPHEIASVPQTPENSMPKNSVAGDFDTPDPDIPQLKHYDPNWEHWEMFKKDAKLTELFPGQRSQIRRCLLTCKQNMRDSIIRLATQPVKPAMSTVPSQGKGQHSKLLMNELMSVNFEKKPEQPSESAVKNENEEREISAEKQRQQMERLEYERLMELYDGDRELTERALEQYRAERAAASAESGNEESTTGTKKRTARGRKTDESLKVSNDAVMPPKWCTTARTRAKATTNSSPASASLHMSDVIRDDATLAALGIPISDEDSDKEDDKVGSSKISQGLRRPILSDEEYKSEDQSEKSEDSDDQMSSGDDDEELDDKAQSKSKKNRSTTGWLSNNRKGVRDFFGGGGRGGGGGGGRKRESDDDFVVNSDDYDSEEAEAQAKHSDRSSEEAEESEDSGDFGAKKKPKKGKDKSKKGKSRKRKAAFFEEEEEIVPMVKSRGIRATKATRDFSEFFKKQRLVVDGDDDKDGDGNEEGENGEKKRKNVDENESDMSDDVEEEESSDEYQASSDPEEYDVGKKAKSKAKAAKMARLKAIREAKVNRRKLKKTSSDEDPDFSPKKGSPAIGARTRKKVVINDESDEDYGDRDFGGGGGSQQYRDSDDSDRAFDYNLTKQDKSAILKFFNCGTSTEIQLVPGLSKKKYDIVVPLRPFANWKDLVIKFQAEKGLNEKLLVEAKSVIDQQARLTSFLKQCESIAVDIEQSVRNLCNRQTLERETEGEGEKDDNENSDNDDEDQIQIVKQPQLLNSDFKLKPYQIIGLNWLYVMFKNNTNAVLSDEMGLGKTIQTIAFLAYLKENNEVYGKQMIIAPASTLENWAREFTDWCPSMKLFLYYGSQEERIDLRRRALTEKEDFDVMITTYNVCISNKMDRTLFKKLHIQYMVIDEGHMLRNMSSLRYQQLMRIKADSRLLLTGTPLQNNLVELVSVLTFVMPNLFSQYTEAFKTHFQAYANRNSSGDEDTSEFETAVIDQAKMIMKPFMLRRLKKDVIKQLPPKKELIVKCFMNEAQRDCYNDIKLNLARSFKDKEEGKEDKRDNRSLSNAMMQLRKATNHKLLHRRIFTVPMMNKLAKILTRTEKYESSKEHFIVEDLTFMSDFEIHQLCQESVKTRKFALPDEDILDSAKIRQLDVLLPEIKEKGEKVLLFSQFVIVLDILQEYLTIRKHKFIRLDGSTGVEQRLLMIDEFNRSSSDDCFVFLLSTRAGGLGINLTSANHVIIHDIDFNPYNDKQAEDRAHRVGQEKEVCVYRLIVENSIDEGMLAIAEEKLKLEENLSSNVRAVPTDSNEGTPAVSENEDSNSISGPQQSSDVATLLGNILDL
ncbi:uncharacterized protein LOC142336493 isoform X2 [Convolutriloba macropyga]|uniref:uncharacterized protein LOC142336493 isoform X2 n=1 Tax=Convolutriloba macropyga TaxID=536237 RepID=UPI003F522C43